MSQTHTVMVILESKSGKEDELKEALVRIAECSRQEDSCIEYRLYQDTGTPSQFGLYEKWKSKELHQEQFSKPYIVEFAKQAEALLAKPYLGVFGEEVSCTKGGTV
ncbi:Uncharacterized protein SCG7086_AW_00160 [Chlamydiales bacterium SCGC AG-110-P3]|nr:Uncharacterized protein SCG7086_AW_00160 [Chlamydiales bacterium SCGC AG-110-P3]